MPESWEMDSMGSRQSLEKTNEKPGIESATNSDATTIPIGKIDFGYEEPGGLYKLLRKYPWLKYVLYGVLALFIIGLHVYLGFAIAYSLHGAIFPIVLFSCAYLYLAYCFILEPLFYKALPTLQPFFNSIVRCFTWSPCCGIPIVGSSIGLGITVAFFAWVVWDAWDNKIRLRSIGGLLMYVILSLLVSANPHRVKWRPVIGGIAQQFVIGLIVLKWKAGSDALSWFSDQVVIFLDYTNNGSTFTYGFASEPPNICGMGTTFLYNSLQIIIYFGSIVSVLYYLGVIEYILAKVALVMYYTLGTTSAESLNAAACVFLGQTESAILIQPALETMTESEIHAVMTAGFACIAGSLFAAYISFGACPSYLLSASVMSAGGSLAIAKLIYPEVQKSSQKRIQDFQFTKSEDSNILECISNGAVHSSKFVFEIGANLIVYLAILAFVNAGVGWAGSLVGYPELSFNEILGYCFFPLAWMMGASDASDPSVNLDETLKVAQLMGMKTVLNEFIAYQSLAQMITDGTLAGARAQMIATYALCGFSNISMIGSQLGILGGMCPRRRPIFAKVVVRALIAGSITCFTTACVAGILVDQAQSCPPSNGANCLNLDDVVNYFVERNLTTPAPAG